MSEENWHGIPRNKIPWGPTINYEKCVACGKCVDYCKLGVYEFEEKQGKKVPVVRNPNNCVVYENSGLSEPVALGKVKINIVGVLRWQEQAQHRHFSFLCESVLFDDVDECVWVEFGDFLSEFLVGFNSD